MPKYELLETIRKSERQRIARRLLDLKAGLKTQVPAKTLDNLVLATWNIREFDSGSFGSRSDEAMLYIAEIIDHFDLVAVQEVRDNLDGLYRLKEVLGRWWDVIFTDVTEGTAGNNERMAFLFDSRKVRFGGLSGEVVLPEEKDENGLLQPVRQLVRTPMMVGFKAGWYDFVMVTVHLIYGEDKADAPERVREAALLSDFLAKRADDPTAWSKNMVLLGDFNIFRPDNLTFEKIAANFYIPEALQKLPSNVPQDKHYDQIAFRSPFVKEFRDRIDSGELQVHAGVFNCFDFVFRESDERIKTYQDEMGAAYLTKSNGKIRTETERSTYYKTYWRTHQISDHLPMWIEIPINRSVPYLQELLK
jgi:endonuclease/exonuclease/phosphatase family metal-dependent hydrolase